MLKLHVDSFRENMETFYASLLTKLDSTIAPDGKTLLDKSAVMGVDEFSWTETHSNANYPVFLAGGVKWGGLKPIGLSIIETSDNLGSPEIKPSDQVFPLIGFSLTF